jgi:predicted nicotinamide N-methyase
VQVGGIEIELTEERVALSRRELTIVHPRQPDVLIDEQAFERDEFLPYWAELWPSGIALARTVERLAAPGVSVVELGCGLALPSIAAALAGARALATDWSPDALEFAAANAARNGASLETAAVSWSHADELVARGPWDLVVAADVLYENRNVAPFLALLPRLAGSHGRVLLADPGRPAARSFHDEAAGRWHVEELPGDAAHPRVTLYELRLRAGRCPG